MVYEYCFGKCVECGKEVELRNYSRYWISAVLKKGTSMFFFPDRDKPFCGYWCAKNYHQEKVYHENPFPKTFVKLTE